MCDPLGEGPASGAGDATGVTLRDRVGSGRGGGRTIRTDRLQEGTTAHIFFILHHETHRCSTRLRQGQCRVASVAPLTPLSPLSLCVFVSFPLAKEQGVVAGVDECEHHVGDAAHVRAHQRLVRIRHHSAR